METTILLFGNLAQIAETNKLILEDIHDIKNVEEYLFTKFPTFKKQKYAVALNQKVTKENQTLRNGDELAFLPPFAGG